MASEPHVARAADLDGQAVVDALAGLGYGVLLVGDDGRIEAVTPAVEQMSGYSAEQLGAMNPWELFTPDSREDVVSWSDHRTGGLLDRTIEASAVRADGTVRTIELAASRVEKGRTVLVVHDVSELVARRTEQHVLGEALEHNPVAVLVLRQDDPSDAGCMTVLAANQAVLDLVDHGLSRGRDLVEQLQDRPDEVRSFLRDVVAALAERRVVVEERHPVLGPSPEQRWVRCSATGLGADVYAFFIEDITEQREAELARREALERVLAASDDERRRIADGLHDDIIQGLAAATLLLQATEPAQESGRESLAAASRAIQASIERLRSLIFELAPPELEDLGLERAIESVAQHLFVGTDTAVDLACEGIDEVESNAATMAYRIAAEALTNVRKHARAGHVEVSLTFDGDRLTGRVADDGLGIEDGVDVSGGPGHLGMRTMRERAELLGGWFDVGSRPDGRGTQVRWSIPARRVPSGVRRPPWYREWRPPPVLEETERPKPRFEAMIEHAPDIITCFDRDLRHVYVNRAVEMATGMPKEAFIGRTNRQLGMPDDLASQWDQVLLQVLESGEPAEQVFVYETPEGPHTFHASIVPEHHEGSTSRVWGIVRDVTSLQGSEG